MVGLRSLVFNFLFYLTLIGMMALGLPSILGGRRAVFSLARSWGVASTWLLKSVCRLEVEYRGLENIPLGGVIVASKHQSFLETFALLRHAPDFSIILKRQLVFVPVFGLYLVVSKQIAINRGRGRKALLQIVSSAAPILESGRQVLIYPEGTRRAPGALPDYKQGVAALYWKTGAACLPVAVNTGLFWSRRTSVRRPGKAVIEYLPPIKTGLNLQTFATELQQGIESACERLNREAIAHDPTLAAMVAGGGAARRARSPNSPDAPARVLD